MIDGYQVYRYHVALHAHFNTVKYDALISQIKTSVTTGSFDKRNDKGIFVHIAHELKDPHIVADYFIANYSNGYKNCIYDFDASYRVYKEWLARKQARTHYLTEDIAYLQEHGTGGAEGLFSALVSNKIKTESFVMIDMVSDFTNNLRGNFVYDEMYALRLFKYRSFIKLSQKQRILIVESEFLL
jgi:hypothetical protein